LDLDLVRAGDFSLFPELTSIVRRVSRTNALAADFDPFNNFERIVR
jgi:hypothetical protein